MGNRYKVWVIGGTSGIGQATAKYLDSRGHAVVATGREVDVTYYDDLLQFWRTHLGYDAVVYSAGINELMWLEDMDQPKALLMYQVNVIGFLNVLKVIAQDDPVRCTSVVAVSSDAAVRPMRTSAAYCASKAALNMVVQCAARELADTAIRVNAVAPGMTANTAMTAYIDAAVPIIREWSSEQAAQYEASQIPMGRRAEPVEVAHVIHDVLFGPNYMTGSIVTINGGR